MNGLDDVVAAETVLSDVDGAAGRLVIRGHAVEELARGATFEDLAALLFDGFFDDLPDDLQIALLGETLDELPKLQDMIEKMMAAWAKGEPKMLASLLNESVETNPELEKRLLTDRNARWADWIKARLEKPGTVFMAVGAGHLAGEKSVQAMLRQRGLVAAQLPNRAR